MEHIEYDSQGKSVNLTVQSIEGATENLESTGGAKLVHEGGTSVDYTNPSSPLHPVPEAIFNSDENFVVENQANLADQNENEFDYVAKPPPHVMTSLGPMPLPIEVRKKIPEKFVAKPIIEEREIYVAKKEVQERTIEIPHVQYEHKFSQIPRMMNIKKLVPSINEIVKEVPREVYKPVIEEKVIEVPQGVKYVEVPVEVPCFYPPKIVPKPREQIVERVVETIKPVVKEKIIEVPQTVVKNVPKIKTVEVPYFVPRYVEKIIEVPYQPGSTNANLPPLMSGIPPNIQGVFQTQGQIPTQEQFSSFPSSFAGAPVPFKFDGHPHGYYGDINVPFESKIEFGVDQKSQMSQMSNLTPEQMNLIKPEKTSIPINLPVGIQWGSPPNAPLPPGNMMPQFLDYPSSAKMPPMMVTFPPEVGNVKYCGKITEPDILTRAGVMPYKGFKSTGTAQILFPPFPQHANVPMNNGVPDFDAINSHHVDSNSVNVLPRYASDSDQYNNGESSFCGSPCCNT